MKHPTRLVATAFFALAMIISAKFIPLNSNVSAQQETKPKFRPAPPGAKNPRPDEWVVSFKTSLSPEECDWEIDRILSQYGAKVLPSAPNDDRPARFPKDRSVAIRVSEEQAKQIAEEEVVVEVTQVAELDAILPQTIQEAIKSAPPSDLKPGEKRPVPGKKPPPKGDKPDSQPEPIDQSEEAIIAARATTFYNLDRIDVRARGFNGVYNNWSDGSSEVDIYFFDSGLDVNHPEFRNSLGGIRAVMFRNPWPEVAFTSPPDHGTMVASAAAGLTTGVANQCIVLMVRPYRIRAGFPNEQITSVTYQSYINDVRQSIISRSPRRAIVNFSTFFRNNDPLLTQGMRNALTTLMNDTRSPVFVAMGQSTMGESRTRSELWPQNQPGVITVGMSDSDDDKVDYQFSYGGSMITVDQWQGIDIFAPAGPTFFDGVPGADELGIYLALGGTTGLTVDAGSSFATPQAAGWAAMYLAQFTTFTPTRNMVRDWMFDNASHVIRSNFLDTGDSNRLIYARAPVVVCRNSASLNAEGIAPDSIATCYSAFGRAPTQLDFHDDNGLVAGTSPSYTSDSQVNFLVPSLPAGIPYAAKATDFGGFLASGAMQINLVAPGLYSYDSDGNGVASGTLYLQNKVTGEVTETTLSPNGNVWNPATHYAYLVCYGTGFRYQFGGSFVQFDKGNTIYTSPTHFQLLFIGDSPCCPGLDQFNVGPLPDAMGNAKGTWLIKLFANGPEGPLLANIVEFKIL